MESGTVPEHKLGSAQASGASPFRFPSVQPLALCCLLQDRLGKVSLRTQTLYASNLNLKVTRCLAYFAGQMEKNVGLYFFPLQKQTYNYH